MCGWGSEEAKEMVMVESTRVSVFFTKHTRVVEKNTLARIHIDKDSRRAHTGFTRGIHAGVHAGTHDESG